MKKRDKKRTFVIKRSGWSAFSLLLYLILGVLIPLFFGLKKLGILTDLPEPFQSLELPIVDSFYMIVVIAWVLVAFVWVCVLVHNAKETKYYWKGNVIVIKNGKVFSEGEENKKFIFSPGMSVYVEQSFKGWFFRYGTVCITMGSATAGEFRMEHVKRPRKVKKYIAQHIIEYSYSEAYTSSPYIANPYAPANIFPGLYGWGGYPYGYMMGGANQNMYPYSAPYGTAGGTHPYNF